MTRCAAGATLATEPTLGWADTSDRGPTAGNGFYQRWPDDIAALQHHGITDVRLTLDWARLQPRPGEFDDGWAETYEQMLIAADAIDLRVWATTYEGAVPRWFDNEGGIDADDALVTWWPRWVGKIAERFGDHVAGWVPFSVIPPGGPDQAWIDTWGILGGGEPPVAAVIADDDLGRAARVAGRCDLVGVDLTCGDDPRAAELDRCAERWAEAIQTASDAVARPAIVSVGLTADDAGAAEAVVEHAIRAIGWARNGGTEVTTCFVDPAIAGPGRTNGLLDTDRVSQPALDALISLPER